MHAESDDGLCSVLPGCAARKFHSSRRNAFQTINAEPIGTIHVGRNGECSINTSVQPPHAKLRTNPSNSTSRFEFYNSAGAHMFADQIELAHHYDAILFHGTGLGHLPIEDSNGDSPENEAMREALEKYCSNGGVAAMTTQCIHGPIHMDVYSKGHDQQEIGVLGNHATLGPDAALVKLHFLLSRDKTLKLGGMPIYAERTNPQYPIEKSIFQLVNLISITPL